VNIFFAGAPDRLPLFIEQYDTLRFAHVNRCHYFDSNAQVHPGTLLLVALRTMKIQVQDLKSEITLHDLQGFRIDLNILEYMQNKHFSQSHPTSAHLRGLWQAQRSRFAN
jgi:hypothetical protein